MALEPVEQFRNFLEKSKEVLIFIPENPSGDAVGAAWALYFFLKKKNVHADIAFSNHLSPKYSFLPQPEKILNKITGARDFVLQFDTDRNKISGVRSEEKDGKLTVFITPEKGTINPKDFSFILAKFKYDLIFVIDTPDLEKLGRIYEENPDLFFEVPIINIDHRSENENFGQLNLVDVTSSSCSEILSNALEAVDPQVIDKTIAECLLSGIISATESFQKKNTTPKALLAAARLMDKGADQQEIIRWLYKTQPLHLLKLWGRAMAKLIWDEKSKMIWTALSVEDFVQSRATTADVSEILEKLHENYSEGRIFMAIYGDTPDSAVVKIRAARNGLLEKIHGLVGGKMEREILEASASSGDLFEIGEAIVKKIKEAGI